MRDTKKNTPRISFVLHSDVREVWDGFMEESGIRTYARLIRDAVRDFIDRSRDKNSSKPEQEIAARVTTNTPFIAGRLYSLFTLLAAQRETEEGTKQPVKLSIRDIFPVTGFTREQIADALNYLEKVDKMVTREGQYWHLV